MYSSKLRQSRKGSSNEPPTSFSELWLLRNIHLESVSHFLGPITARAIKFITFLSGE